MRELALKKQEKYNLYGISMENLQNHLLHIVHLLQGQEIIRNTITSHLILRGINYLGNFQGKLTFGFLLIMAKSILLIFLLNIPMLQAANNISSYKLI